MDSAKSNPNSVVVTSPKVRFDSPVEEDEQTRLRRGTVSPDLKNQIALRSLLGRKAVSLGYATNRAFSRSQSEASIFRPLVRPPTLTSVEDLDNPSNTLWESGYTQLSRVKSTSSVIGGLNDDVLRAGWRRNEPGPYWEQSNELELDRQISDLNQPTNQFDGFDLDELDELDESNSNQDLDQSVINNNQDINDLNYLNSSLNDQIEDDQLTDLPKSNTLLNFNSNHNHHHQFSKTKSMPVGGTFGTRPDQPTFYRPFDDTFMRMDVPF